MVFDKKVPHSVEDKPFWVFNKTNQKYDYAIGGSSRAYNNADIVTTDRVLGRKGINIGFSGSGLAENYLTLYLFLKKGNKIKNYVLQLDDWSLINPDSSFSYPFHEYYFFPYMSDNEVCATIRENRPYIKYLVWKYLPFVKYSEFNNIFPFQNSFKSVPPVFDSLMGTGLLAGKHKDNEGMNGEGRIVEHKLYRNNLKYLDKIIQLCKTEKINLLFYTSPIYDKFFEKLKRDECRSCIDSINKEHNIKYLNFTLDPHFKDTALLYNETHLNMSGTLLFSGILADSLNKYLIK
jgi:hypothetical protein